MNPVIQHDDWSWQILALVNSNPIPHRDMDYFLRTDYTPQAMVHYNSISDMAARFYRNQNERQYSLCFRLLGINLLVQNNKLSGWAEQKENKIEAHRYIFMSACGCKLIENNNAELTFDPSQLIRRAIVLHNSGLV